MSVAFSQLTSRIRSINETPAPPIHWPSALLGLVLAIIVVVGISWAASPRADRPLALAVAHIEGPPVARGESPPAMMVVPTPIPPPPPPTPEPVVERLKVANTNGSGVNLRARAGERGQRLKTMPEGSGLEVIGADETADGIVWRNVKDASGTSGWVAGKFVARAQ
jgi:hypothetical protein